MKKQYTSDFYTKRTIVTQLSAKVIVGIVFASIKPDSVIDFGCATGLWLAEFSRRGSAEVFGLDGDWVDRKLLVISTKQFSVHNFGVDKYRSSRKYDLALCVEVAEHIPEDMGVLLIESIVEVSDVVLFSAAIVGQGGSGHVNEQPQHYWASKFAMHGYVCVDLIRPEVWNNNNVNVVYKQNMLLFVRESVLERLKFSSNKIISHAFEIDRIHPDLLAMKVGSQDAKIWSRISRELNVLWQKMGWH